MRNVIELHILDTPAFPSVLPDKISAQIEVRHHIDAKQKILRTMPTFSVPITAHPLLCRHRACSGSASG